MCTNDRTDQTVRVKISCRELHQGQCGQGNLRVSADVLSEPFSPSYVPVRSRRAGWVAHMNAAELSKGSARRNDAPDVQRGDY